LIERTLNFVFGTSSDGENEIEIYKNNSAAVSEAMSEASLQTKSKLLYILWQQLAEANYEEVANYVSTEFLLPIAKEMNDTKLSDELVSFRNVSFGKIAPDFDIDFLQENNTVTRKLTALDTSESYILVFWSSTCSHCLEELPQLHEFMKTYEKEKVQVIAFGIEDEAYRWKNSTSNYPDFIHVLGLGKWENDVAIAYNISATPSYFILDKDKTIISKPNDIFELKKYFSDQK
jgi:thiol-disulfide isomerase/thioredoxin